MKRANIAKGRDDYPTEGLKATLEKKYIEEYLLSRGYRRKDLRKLTKDQAKRLMVEASTHASLKLEDIESRARFRKMIYGSS
jgi:hypothetical protein